MSLIAEESPEDAPRPVVCLVGVGHLGSRIADVAARMGFPLILVDHDRVEPHNLENQLLFGEDVGKPKAEAIATRLNAAGLGNVVPHVSYFEHLDLREVLGGVSLVVCTVDAPGTRANVGIACRSLEIPAIFAGIDVLGETGEVFYQTAREGAPCWGCFVDSEDPPISCAVVREPRAVGLGLHVIAHCMTWTRQVLSGDPPQFPLLRVRSDGSYLTAMVRVKPSCRSCTGVHYLRRATISGEAANESG